MTKKEHIKVLFEHNAFDNISFESAWVIVNEGEYILNNILFYAKSFSLGDKINVVNKDGNLYANGLVKESGNSTVRLLITSQNKVSQVREELKKIGCTSELSNMDTLISVDIPNNVSYLKIKKYLDEGELKGEWEYEEACISNFHRNN